MTFNPLTHPRTETTGQFSATVHGLPEVNLGTPPVVCTECGVQRARGTAHRCPSPDLVDLSAATKKVLAACRAAGGRPIIVGGSVRDALIQKTTGTRTPPKDIDIEVYGVPGYEPLLAQLSKLGSVDLAGASFGVLIARVDGEDFDVALPRTDRQTGVGHTGFETTPDSELDEVAASSRRDFTINAMGWDPTTGELVDAWGGTADLADGVLRHPTEAFTEDALRVLRAVRFSSRYGFALAPETADLAQTIADRYTEIPVERVWGEWRKIAQSGTSVTRALNTLVETGWIEHYPELNATRGCEQDPEWHPEGDVFAHLGFAADEAATAATRDGLTGEDRDVVVLGALVHDLGKPVSSQVKVGDDGRTRITSYGHAEAGEPVAERFLRSIGAPNSVVNRVLPIVREHMCHASVKSDVPSASAVRRLMRRLADGSSGTTIYDWARVVAADSAGRGSAARPSPVASWLEVAEHVGPTARAGILRGTHLLAAGWKPEPAWRFVTDAAVEAQDDGLIFDEASALTWFAEHGERIRAEHPKPVRETPGERKLRLKAVKAARKAAESSGAA
jgi:tRNA nucleotidyltransferase (CCA-adding enzyme)